ncbi:penicillin-binding transpeptidase domain-containing protein [Acidicapsa ligni]|uniref:penicillin-binding transpeptidase domain-containing protein n=1 Tax=Acidicapsa ligni TaxID=542300 RepID=UPI0021E085BF|nr:penicillin-binding transpeptidase domain-containing protein [Acidicapsa ligni]
MKKLLSCVAFAAMVCGVVPGSLRMASAVDVPRNVHHARTTHAHIVERHGVHGTSAHRVAGSTAAGHAKTAHLSAHAGTRGVATVVGTGRRGRVRRTTLSVRGHRSYERFTASSFSNTQGDGDITAGEDPTIRAAAIEALGNMNGTAVVINPANGRILAMVNQKLALSPGAEPCSTIKLTVGMAALSEGLVTRNTPVNLGGFRMNLTEALAHSNNLYFEEMGRELGFERVRHYATQFGLGELAGYDISGEQLGTYPDHELPAKEGGVGRMCSFGQGVSMTPLQLGAFVASIANGGTLYYLQHPTTQAAIASFIPKIKRTLDIARFIPEMQDGMAGAVEYGTARRLRVNFHELPVFGKTGTCSNNGTRFGWFASYSDSPMGSLVTVFFLEGGRPVFGPRAAELTGVFYRSLWDKNYFVDKGTGPVQAQTYELPTRTRESVQTTGKF